MTPPTIRRMMKNHTSAGLPKHAIFVDTETYTEGEEQLLHFGFAEEWADRRHRAGTPKLQQCSELLFDEAEDFWEYVEGCAVEKQELYIVAHNFGGFDLMVLRGLENLNRLGWTAQKVIIGTPPFVIRVRKGKKTVILIDSLNYFRTSLAELADSIGETKGQDPGMGGDIAERIVYCKQDVKILRIAMMKYWEFVGAHDLGTYAVTLAGQAMNAWRHRFMPDTPVVINHEPDVSALEREAYCGGTVREFHRGTFEDVSMFDANSMFPHKMRDRLFPVQMMHRTTHDSLVKLQATRQNGYGHIAEVWVNTDKDWYPVKSGDRLIFPVGRFRTVLCGPELYRALDHGHVERVGRLHIYRMADMFSTYIDEFYDLRLKFKENGDPVFAYMCKIFLNSLYGKFGQRTPEWQSCRASDAGIPVIDTSAATQMDIWDGEKVVAHARVVLGHVEKWSDTKTESYNSMCSVAAFVTSYAREDLLQVMEEVGRDHVLYCDTDSVFLLPTGVARLEASGRVHDKRLGAWKADCGWKHHGPCEDPRPLGTAPCSPHHGPGPAQFECRGLKDYSYNGLSKIKGVRVHSSTTVQHSDDVYEQDMFVSARGAIRRGHPDSMVVKRVVKHLSRACLKGHLAPSGRIDPLTLSLPLGNIEGSIRSPGG